ncbi:MAG: DUF1080 domain-containing protein [Phenylobacterium sp.]|uniref:3-keto-disaccharide hydrolase n=1 Tax=Phenylobacterium sp. TaxID=1871053 RepID=UPI0025F42E59|nr:DUF1080 domain-containing protein [Phenylobacterium sp.]MBA4010488.1 DUF1080 domain-containing protein [Phenylobacterium sp.]
MGYIASRQGNAETRVHTFREETDIPTPSCRPAAALATLAVFALLAAPAHAEAGKWRPIFDGRTLDGWTPKIAGFPAGENYADTFVVRDGAIAVSYAGYDGKFGGKFGHLFYKTPFKAYRLRLNYRVLDPALPDTPAWARSNSGLMFDSQSPQSMSLGQSFPMSVEFQILGRDGEAPRPTGAVCTPGTSITFGGVKAKEHCIPSTTAPTIANGTWTSLELEVLPSGQVTQKINGQVVHRYADVALDPTDNFAAVAKPYFETHTTTEGYIALQSEGHPIEFKDIEVQELR